MSSEQLIGSLIERLCSLKGVYRVKEVGAKLTPIQLDQQTISQETEETLVRLSSSKLNEVVRLLVERITKGGLNDDLQFQLFDILGRSLHNEWKKIEPISNTTRLSIEKKQEAATEPKASILKDSLATKALNILHTLLKDSPVAKPGEDTSPFYQKIGTVLFYLSAVKPGVIIPKITSIVTTGPDAKETDEITNQYLMIEYLNLNMARLADFINKVNQVSANYTKKTSYQGLLARVMRKAIWNWIDNYPAEFFELSRSGHPLGGNPEALFDTIESWNVASKEKMKRDFWPVQTMLLILCPDLLLTVSMGTTKEKTDSYLLKEKFLDSLKKALKSNKGSDVAAICYVDICKAATFVSKEEISALRYMVPSVEIDLNEKLFDPKNPFKRSFDNEVDIKLLTDCLVSLFRLSPVKANNTLFPECLKPESPGHFKQVLIKALLQIAEEGGRLPWNPTITDVYSTLALPIRHLFMEYVRSASQYDSLLNEKTDKKVKQQQEKLSLDIAILNDLISLFIVDPKLPLFPMDTVSQNLDATKNLLLGLVACVGTFGLPELSDRAAQSIMEFHQVQHIEKWCVKNMIDGFWEISSAVNSALCTIMLEKSDKAANVLKVITVLQVILSQRNQFLRVHLNGGPPKVSDERTKSCVNLETAFLTYLCSGDSDICSKSASSFGLLCEEIEILGDDPSNGIFSNYEVYKKLSSSGVLSTGRVAQQLAIRKLLRRIERQTTGNFGAWQQVYDRWAAATKVVLTFEDDTESGVKELKKQKSTKDLETTKTYGDKAKSELQEEWRNFTGFLVALSGVCLNRDAVIKVADPKAPKKKEIEKTVKVIDSFMDELEEYLIVDNKYVREAVMSLTGTSISHVAYPVLFRHLYHAIRKNFSVDKGQVNISKGATLFVEQSISLVRHIIELPQDTDNLSLLTDFEILLDIFVRYVSQLVVDETSVAMKKRTCLLIESMMQKRQYISFRNELKFRNSLVESILEWTSDFVSKSEESLPKGPRSAPANTVSKNSDEFKKLFSDLDVEVIKALGMLLRGLPLDAGNSQESEKAKSRFVKYFTFFSNLLSRYNSEKDSRSELAEFTVQCLSNLLGSNIGAGLEYFVTMGYHSDFATRTAFLQVTRNILIQGTDFELGEGGDKYDKFVQLLFESDLSVALAICDVTQITEADEVASLLVRIFEAHDKTIALLKLAINAEISRTESESTLFRRNSMVTKLLGAYGKLIGKEYLHDMLAPTLQNIVSNPSPFEMDPTKLPTGQNPETNLANVTKISQQILDSIIKSVDRCPMQFREVCQLISKGVAQRFPGFEEAAVGAFVFLRFICPAVVSPEGFGLIAEVPQETRRGLVLATKSIQNLANGQVFQVDKKESFMVGMNTFIQQNADNISQVLKSFATVPPSSQAFASAPISDEQRETDLGALHQHVTVSLEKIGRILSDQQKGSSFDRLTSILEKLGAPPEPTHSSQGSLRNHSQTGKGQNTNSFFDRNLNTDKIKEKNIFYKGTSKDKTIFYLIARRFSNSDPDIEMEPLLLHILKTGHGSFSKPFSVVVDCSLFGPSNQLPPSWGSYLLKHFPAFAEANLEKIIIINPNQTFKKYSQNIKKLLSRSSQKKISIFSNAMKLTELIAESDLLLPPETLAIEKDLKASFSPVLRISQYSQNEVLVRISGDFFQLLTVKQHPIFGKNSALLELVPISSITHIIHSQEEHEITIKSSMGTETRNLIIKSTSSVQIIERLNASKKLQRLTQKDGVSSRAVNNPSDVPGTLLNMGLLNLGTDNDELRLAAYNMLEALSSYFNFSIRLQLFHTNGLSIPRHTFHFIIKLSEKLSATEPGLTLEFLLECLQGLSLSKASPQLKHLCLDYMRPWFPNLSKFYHLTNDPDSAEKVAKTKEVIDSLLEFTIQESAIVTIVLSTVWETIGTVSDILGTVLECCIARAIKGGLGSSELEVIGSVISTLASQNSSLITGKLIARLMELIGSTSQSIIDRLDDHPSWEIISIHLRLLFMLSFDNLLHVQQYLPDLFHLIMMLFSTGSSYIRATVHGLLINILHSLYNVQVSAENKLVGLRFHISELSQPKSLLLFGLGGRNTNPFSAPNPEEKKADKLALSTVNTIAISLYSILSAVSPMNNPIGTTWHARWLSLTTKTSFTSNIALQPRACITLGVLSKSTSLVSDDLVEMLLVALKEALRGTTYDAGDDLSISLIMSLTHIYEFLSPESPYYKPFFWIAMSIIKITDMNLFHASLGLLETILRVQDENECFKKGVEETFNVAREGPIDQIVDKLDNMSGLTFKSHFSFAVSSHLLKGLKNSRTKESTSRVLSSFLDITAKGPVGSNILGYIAALLPVEGELPILKDLAIGGGGKHLHQYFFTEQLLPDEKHAALLFAFLFTILQNTEKEYEQIFIYDALKEGVKFMPEAFNVIKELLFPVMHDSALQLSQNPALLESVYSIMNSVYEFIEKNPHPKLTKAFLEEIEFPQLPQCATFTIDPHSKREITKLVILLLENLLNEVQNKRKS